jgi:hypothetical protein
LRQHDGEWDRRADAELPDDVGLANDNRPVANGDRRGGGGVKVLVIATP